MTHPQTPFKSMLGPKPVTALPAPASLQAPALQEASTSIPQTSTTKSSSEAETRQGDAAIRKVHFILNSKGGVGKSFIAFLLALHYRHLREPVLCFDADATTATFSRFAALNVTRITLMEGTILNARRFDEMLEPILAEDAHCVVVCWRRDLSRRPNQTYKGGLRKAPALFPGGTEESCARCRCKDAFNPARASSRIYRSR